MQNRTKTEEFLRATPLPEATKSYTVISHGYIIDKIRTMLELKGFKVKEELYKGESAGDVGMGFMHLENDKDPDMGMTFNWTNSYNKKLKFSCAIGGFIYDNSVPFVSSDAKSKYIRKHTGTALEDVDDVIEQMIEQAEEHFDRIIEMKNKFTQVEVSRKDYAKLMGLLYFDKEIISSEQVNLVKREYEKPSFKYNNLGTLWGLYKIIMHAIVDQSPVKWYQQQIKINNYIQIMFDIAQEDNRDGDTFKAVDEESEQTTLDLGSDLSEEQIEMVESEFAYATPLVETGVTEFPLEGNLVQDPDSVQGDDVVIEDVFIEEKSEEFVEIDSVLEEKEPVSFFASLDEEEEMFEEDEEDQVIIENDYDEIDDMILNEDSSDEPESLPTEVAEEVPADYVPWKTEEKEIKPKAVIELHTDDLFELEEDEAVVINPAIGGFIERFYHSDPDQKVTVTEAPTYTIVELDSYETFVI